MQFILGLVVQAQNSNFCYDTGAFFEKTFELNRRAKQGHWHYVSTVSSTK